MGTFDLEGASSAEIYAAVISLPAADFDELMADAERRPLVIGALIDHMAGLFKPEAAGDLDVAIQIKLWDRPGGGYDHYELRIAGGTCTISDEPGDDPRLTIKIRPGDLRALVAGETGPRRLVLRRRLTVLGDLALGMKLQELFAFD